MNLNYLRDDILHKLKNLGTPEDKDGLERFGIPSDKAFGIRKPKIRNLAKELKIKNNELADLLWETGYLEARILASLIAEPKSITKSTINRWISDVDNWDLCDQLTSNLVDKTPFADELVFEWVKSKNTFTRRAGFATIAWIAVHNKKLTNDHFNQYFTPILKGAENENEKIVLKAIDWAGRQIGKRNLLLNKKMQSLAFEMIESNKGKSRSTGNIILKELASDKVITRLNQK